MRLTEEQITNRLKLHLEVGLAPIRFDGDEIADYDFENINLRYISFRGTAFVNVNFDNVSLTYCGCGTSLPCIEQKDNLYQYAFVDNNDKVIGFLTYRINVYTDTVRDFGLISFDKGNLTVARDLHKKLEELIKNHHKVEWAVIEGNLAKRSYDRFCKKHGGYIHHHHDTTRDRNGKFLDSFSYEIIKKRYYKVKI